MNEYGALAAGCFIGATVAYLECASTSYALAMAALLTITFVGLYLAATSCLRVILRKPSSNERNDA